MSDVILFGGTTEGRQLAEAFAARHTDALVCVATAYGAELLPIGVRSRVGRLPAPAIKALIETERPKLVIDATHPYADQISANIRAACAPPVYARLKRPRLEADGCHTFADMPALAAWLQHQPGIIFSALGAKEAPALSAFRDRTWLRILPDADSLATCLAAGFAKERLICMQGPFSRALNAAMFQASGAAMLLTKESGAAGGFAEKAEAARDCGMAVAVLARPTAEDGFSQEGYSIEDIMRRIDSL